jgi:hypothetical protein
MSAYVCVGRSVGCICACRDCRQYNGGNQSKYPVNHIGYLLIEVRKTTVEKRRKITNKPIYAQYLIIVIVEKKEGLV